MVNERRTNTILKSEPDNLILESRNTIYSEDSWKLKFSLVSTGSFVMFRTDNRVYF